MPAAFHEHRADDLVAGVRIGVKLVEGIIGGTRDRFDESMPRFGECPDQRAQVPQVMVRIDDRQFGFENIFGHWLRSPLRLPSVSPGDGTQVRPF